MIVDDVVNTQIGIYEIMSTELIGIYDDDGDIDLNKLEKPRMYSYSDILLKKYSEEQEEKLQSEQTILQAQKNELRTEKYVFQTEKNSLQSEKDNLQIKKTNSKPKKTNSEPKKTTSKKLWQSKKPKL